MRYPVESVIVKALEREIEAKLKLDVNGPNLANLSLSERVEAIRAILGRAVQFARMRGVSAYDLTLCFTEACVNKGIHAAEDAWFECGFHYAETEFAGAKSRWGEL